MANHNYFGKIEKHEFGAGFQSEFTVHIPFFNKDVTIYLGDEYDEEWEPIETPPTTQQLDQFEQTLSSFIANINNIILDIQESALEYYKKYYSKYYEQEFEVIFTSDNVQSLKEGEIHHPLGIDSKEKHFEYMKDILEAIRVSDDYTIRIPIHYDLDQEHGLEIKLVQNKVITIGGIAET